MRRWTAPVRALRIDPSLPGAHFVRAEALLLRGEWAEGWEEYEWRFRIGGAAPLMPPTGKPQWDGSALRDGTLLLIADQGFGDVIQFAATSRGRPNAARDIAIACSAEMRPLLRQIAPAARQFVRWEDCAATSRRICPLSGLPRLARHAHRQRARADALSARRSVPRARSGRERLDGLVPRGFRRVGVIWAGRPTHNNDRNRSALLADFRPLAERARCCAAGVAEGSEDRPGRRRISGARR